MRPDICVLVRPIKSTNEKPSTGVDVKKSVGNNISVNIRKMMLESSCRQA